MNGNNLNESLESRLTKIIKKDTAIFERGDVSDETVNPLLQLIMLDDLQVALAKLNKHFEKEEFEGYEDPRTLSVTDQVQSIRLIGDWPFAPWIAGYFFNDGPGKAYIALNYRADWIPLNKGEDARVDHAGGDRRIEFIYYKCDPGETATVRAIGKY